MQKQQFTTCEDDIQTKRTGLLSSYSSSSNSISTISLHDSNNNISLYNDNQLQNNFDISLYDDNCNTTDTHALLDNDYATTNSAHCNDSTDVTSDTSITKICCDGVECSVDSNRDESRICNDSNDFQSANTAGSVSTSRLSTT